MTLKPRAGAAGEGGKTKKSTKKSPTKRPADKETIQLVAQEIKFARSLAGNEKKSRDRVLKTLRKWLTIRCEQNYEFKEDDFMRIWKGLFYAMWMSDKPLIQEELSESISGLMDVFPEGRSQAAALFFKVGLRSLATEWYGLDQHRMDKFLMFVRRLLRASFRFVRRNDWSAEACLHLADALGAADAILAPDPPSYARNALALRLHIVDCFAEELAKVSEGSLPDRALVELLHPLATCMALSAERRLSGSIKRNVFVHLLRQSPAGLEYEEKKRAWTQMGCPEGGVDCIEKVSDDEEESEGFEDEARESALDPRAGHVDVTLPLLPVPAAGLVAILRPLAVDRRTQTDNRKRVRVLIQHLEELSGGGYPLRAREADMWSQAAEGRGRGRGPRPARAALRLREFEKKVIAESDELALRGLSRKHRKRVLAKTRERLASGNEPDARTDGNTKKRKHERTNTSGEWKVEEATPREKKNKEEKNQKSNKRKIPTTLVDEVPLKKLKKILKEKETNQRSPEEKAKDSKKNTEKSKNDEHHKISKVKNDEGTKKVTHKNTSTDSKKVEKSKNVHADKKAFKQINEIPVVKDKKVKNKVKSDKTSKENNKEASKVRIVTKKITTAKSKIASPEKKAHEKSDFREHKSKLRGKKVEKTEKISSDISKKMTPKKVTIMLKNNTAQGPVDYYKSVKQSPSIPFDSTKKPTKTNLKPFAPSPINPFFKKKLRLRL